MAHRPPPPRSYCKSPAKVIKFSRQVAAQALPAFFSRFSRKDFTLQQLFPLLVLRIQFDADYRAIASYVQDFECIQQWLELSRTPHYSTLCRAAQRLAARFSVLLNQVIRMAIGSRFLIPGIRAAVDCSGFEDRHTSRYYAARCGISPGKQRYWIKLAVVCDTRTHLFVGAIALRGPGDEYGLWSPVLQQAAARVRIDVGLGDAGFDSEQNHVFARKKLGIRQTLIALNPRTHGNKCPQTRFRKEMHLHPRPKTYAQRSHVESAFSQHKRILSSDLTARSEQTRIAEVLLRVLAHNILLLILRRVATKLLNGRGNCGARFASR